MHHITLICQESRADMRPNQFIFQLLNLFAVSLNKINYNLEKVPIVYNLLVYSKIYQFCRNKIGKTMRPKRKLLVYNNIQIKKCTLHGANPKEWNQMARVFTHGKSNLSEDWTNENIFLNKSLSTSGQV